FQTPTAIINSVSTGALLTTFGVLWDSPLRPVLALVALGALAAMFWRASDTAWHAALPRRALVLLAATGWLVGNWWNYYALLRCVLLPYYARSHPRGAAVAAAGMAVSFALPGFQDPLLIERPALHALKLLPYVLVPAWMVALELQPARWPRAARRLAWGMACVLTGLVVAETWRAHAAGDLLQAGLRAAAAGDAASAASLDHAAGRLAPTIPAAPMHEAIALAALGRM